METHWNILEDLLHEKIMSYQELVVCLQRERALLIETDMDGLWEISDKKQSLVARIEQIRNQILETLVRAGVIHTMDLSSFSLSSVLSLIPHKEQNRFRKGYLALVGLKAETKQRSLENKRHVEESLEFLDELIGIIADSKGARRSYGNRGTLNPRASSNVLLNREV